MQLCEAGGEEILAIGPASDFPNGGDDNCFEVQVMVDPEVSTFAGGNNSTMSGVASATSAMAVARSTKRAMGMGMGMKKRTVV